MGAVRYRIGLARGANLRLIDTDTVRIQLRQANVPIDEDHGIQKRNERNWTQLVRSSLEFIERQGGHQVPSICQIRRHHWRTTQCGIDEHIKKAFVTGIGEYFCAGKQHAVLLCILSNESLRGRQVGRRHVIARILVDNHEIA